MNLYIMNGYEEGRWIVLDGDAVLAGRSESAEHAGERNRVVFPHDREISGIHARFIRGEKAWRVENLGKTGTFVNETNVRQPCDLAPGDVIRMGRTLLLVCETENTLPALRVAAVAIK